MAKDSMKLGKAGSDRVKVKAGEKSTATLDEEDEEVEETVTGGATAVLDPEIGKEEPIPADEEGDSNPNRTVRFSCSRDVSPAPVVGAFRPAEHDLYALSSGSTYKLPAFVAEVYSDRKMGHIIR